MKLRKKCQPISRFLSCAPKLMHLTFRKRTMDLDSPQEDQFRIQSNNRRCVRPSALLRKRPLGRITLSLSPSITPRCTRRRGSSLSRSERIFLSNLLICRLKFWFRNHKRSSQRSYKYSSKNCKSLSIIYNWIYSSLKCIKINNNAI